MRKRARAHETEYLSSRINRPEDNGPVHLSGTSV